MRYRIRALTAVAILTIATNAWADNAVTRWVEQALQTVRVQNIGSPASRLYAMVTVAMYDAVNGIDRARHLSTREDALVSLPGAPAFGDRRAAAAAAAHAVLKSFVPEGSAQASALDAALTAELESLARAPQAVVDAGRAWGAAVGEAVIAARANDNTQTPETKPAGTGVYVYRADFADAEFRSMVPFGIESIDPYVATNLPDLASDRYAESFNETKALGDVNDPDATRAGNRSALAGRGQHDDRDRALVQGGARRRRAAGHLAVPFAYRAALCAARHGHCRRVRHRMAGKVPGLFLATWHGHPRSGPRRQPEHRCGSQLDSSERLVRQLA